MFEPWGVYETFRSAVENKWSGGEVVFVREVLPRTKKKGKGKK